MADPGLLSLVKEHLNLAEFINTDPSGKQALQQELKEYIKKHEELRLRSESQDMG